MSPEKGTVYYTYEFADRNAHVQSLLTKQQLDTPNAQTPFQVIVVGYTIQSR
jgi:hypothetical protein